MTQSTNQKAAVDSIGKALESAFKKFTLSTRRKAWEKLHSKDGKAAINKIIMDPSRNVKSLFEPLKGFKEWMEDN